MFNPATQRISIHDDLSPRSKANLTEIQVVDEVYDQTRKAVDWEIDQVDKYFLKENRQGKTAEEIELPILLDEKVELDKQMKRDAELKAERERQKK